MAAGIEKGALLIRGEVSSGIPKTVAVDSDGKILTVIQGTDGTGTMHTLLVDSAGQMLAALQGDYGGSPKTIAVDSTGRMLADTQLLGASEIDFNSFYPGCDRRFTIGDGSIKNLDHRVKACNSSLNVIRYISAVGSSSAAGYYLLTLGDQGELCRGIGINESVYDTKTVKFGSIGSDFAITRDNCTINGLVLEMLTPTNRIEDDDVTTYDYGNESGEGPYALDYEGLTYINKTITRDTNIFQITFPETDILSIAVYGDTFITSPSTTGCTITAGYYTGGAWVEYTVDSSNASNTWENYLETPLTGVTKFRLYATRGNATTVKIYVRDVTILRDDS